LIHGIISQDIKRPERKTSHSPLSGAEVNKLSSFITPTEVDKYSYNYNFKPTVHATLKNSLSYGGECVYYKETYVNVYGKFCCLFREQQKTNMSHKHKEYFAVKERSSTVLSAAKKADVCSETVQF